MRLLEAELTRLVAFKSIGLLRLHLTTSSALQLILGTNGSGKSSLLRELPPLPASRPDYDSGGYRRLVYSHQGSVYTLTSDFRNRTAPHSFVKDGVELNEGGTTQVQEELVVQHLGYTALVNQITTNKTALCAMTAAQRRTLLMTVNPYRLDFVLERHKQVSARLRACKSVLADLYTRKTALEGEFIPAEQLQALRAEAERLNREVALLVEHSHRVQEAQRQLATQADGVLDVARLRREVRVFAHRAHHIARARMAHPLARAHDGRALEAQLASLDTALAHTDERVSEVARAVDNQHAALAELAAARPADDADMAAVQRERDRQRAQAHGASPLPPAVLAALPEDLEALRAALHPFIEEPPVTTPARAERHARWRYRAQAALQDSDRALAELRRRHQQLTQSLATQPSSIPDQPCAKLACPLYARFFRDTSELRQELVVVDAQLARRERRRARLLGYLQAVGQLLAQHTRQAPWREQVTRLLGRFSVLGEAVRGLAVEHSLRHNPLSLYERLRGHYERALAADTAERLSAQLRELAALRQQQASVSEAERALLQRQLAEREAELARLRSRAQGLHQTRQRTAGAVRLLGAHERAREDWHHLHDELRCAHALALRQHEDQLLRAMAEVLATARKAAVSRLASIEHSLRQQEVLEARYQEEVVKQIARVETERDGLQLLEEALSPATGIPHTYTLDFVNALITSANRWIAMVFSYPLALIPLRADDALDYRFAVQNQGEVVPDVSLCSTAQQEIINLAFTLALMQHLGLRDYPLQLDESGRSFDPYHKQRLIDLLRYVVDHQVVSQLFLVNHHAAVHEGLANAEILVLSAANLLTPPVYNTHAVLET